MNKYTYRKLISKLSPFLITFFFFALFACDEEESRNYGNPTINILEEPGFVSKDTIISVSQTFKFKIQTEWNGHNRLTNLIVKMNGDRYIDLGFYKEIYDREIEVTKGLDDIENWEFIIRDFEGNSASTGLIVTKDPNVEYGDIEEFLNVQLGAQSSYEYGSFFSFSKGIVYNLEGAYNNQELIHMLYYYDDFTTSLEENVITSPGANNLNGIFPGQYDVSDWAIKNAVKFSRAKLNISTEEFDQASNDSLLIANSYAFDSGDVRNKAKFLSNGDIYSFVTENNIIGILKVVSVSGTTEGNIIVDVKIQKQ